MNQKSVIFFDGVCGLCNGFVNFVMSIDRHQHYFFCPLQSEFAQKTLPIEVVQDLDSVVCLEKNKIYTKSTAVLVIMKNMGGIWKVSQMGYILPERFRDWIYDLVAKNRYRFFGKKETCRLPSPEERARFIS